MSRNYLKVGDVITWYSWGGKTITVARITSEYVHATEPLKPGSANLVWHDPTNVSSTGWIIVKPVVESNAILKSGGNI